MENQPGLDGDEEDNDNDVAAAIAQGTDAVRSSIRLRPVFLWTSGPRPVHLGDSDVALGCFS